MRGRIRNLITTVRHLQHMLQVSMWESVPDPRSPRGVRHPWTALLQCLLLGLVTRCYTLRDVEELLWIMPAKFRTRLGVARPPSDSTLYRTLLALSPDQLLDVLVQQVRQMWRARQLEPLPQTPLNLVSIDGKVITKDAAGTHPEVQKRRNRKGGPESYCLLALRAVHVASAVKPALGQLVVPAGTGESKKVVEFAQRLREVYGALVGCIFFDAGLSGESNRFWLGASGIDYIAAIKGNNGWVYRQIRYALGKDGNPPVGGWGWTQQEKRNGTLEVRYFARKEVNGFADGETWRQFWRVRKEIWSPDGTIRAAEEHYFVTSLPMNRLTDEQCLACVRAHWGIENDCNWTLDTQWEEDTSAWAWKNKALEALGVLRLIAYNIVRLLRQRVLRSLDNRMLPYRTLFTLLRDAVITCEITIPVCV